MRQSSEPRRSAWPEFQAIVAGWRTQGRSILSSHAKHVSDRLRAVEDGNGEPWTVPMLTARGDYALSATPTNGPPEGSRAGDIPTMAATVAFTPVSEGIRPCDRRKSSSSP